MKVLYVLLFFVFFVTNHSYAQTDSLKRKQDSLLNVVLDKQQAQIKALTAERLADSLKKVTLQQQLSMANQVQKAALLQKLNTLKTKDSLRHARQQHQVDSLRTFVKGFPVVPFRDTLFYLFTRQGSFTPQERAAAVSMRIRQLAGIPNFRSDSLRLQPSEQTTDVIYNDRLLLSISEEDALWQNSGKTVLANLLCDKISTAITKHREETRWQTILKESLFALLVILVTGFIIYIIGRLFRWLLSKTTEPGGWLSRGIRIRNYELLNAGNMLAVTRNVLNVIRWMLIILVIYLALPILFGIFPFTKDVSALLLTSLIDPIKKIAHAVWNYIPDLITIIVLVIVFRYVLRFFKFLRSEIEKGQLRIPGFYPDWANPTYQIIRVLVLAFMLIVIFPYLPGSESGVLKVFLCLWVCFSRSVRQARWVMSLPD